MSHFEDFPLTVKVSNAAWLKMCATQHNGKAIKEDCINNNLLSFFLSFFPLSVVVVVGFHLSESPS